MGSWPSDPAFTDLININQGNEYNPGDGVTFGDLNAVVKNMLYLSNHGGERIPFIEIDCNHSNYSLTIRPNVAYKITNCLRLSLYAPQVDPEVHYLTHIFISFAEGVSGYQVGVLNYTDLPEYGDSLSAAGSGESCELSIDNQGGILCLKK